MKRLFACMAAVVLFAAIACVLAAPKAPEGGVSAEMEQDPYANVKSLSASAIVTEGRAPQEEYDLPGAISRQNKLGTVSKIVLLAEGEDIAFYGLARGEGYPALLRWGEAMAEFDWRYLTPRTVEPSIWRFDFDGDGSDELAADCYYGSGTGVSMSELHVVEKAADGTLTAYTFPVDVLMPAVGNLLTLVRAGNTTYAHLSGEEVDISAALGEISIDLEEHDLAIGPALEFERTDQGMECRMGVEVRGGDVLPNWYVADVTARVLYKDGTFILDEFHLEGY